MITDEMVEVACVAAADTIAAGYHARRDGPSKRCAEREMRAALEAVLPMIRAGVVETDAARDVLAERQRQISAEGWTPEHDDEHGRMEMSRAARCYIFKAILTENDDTSYNPHLASGEQYDPPYKTGNPPQGWPWADKWWKPKGSRTDLVRAGALILAEIERLDRALSSREAGE